MSDLALLAPDATMTVAELLTEIATTLEASEVVDPRAEARDMIAALVDEPRFWPVTHRDTRLPESVVDAARRAARRQAQGAPFAYAVGRSAFRHLTLEVDERVLIPRQETELLIDEVMSACGARVGGAAVDIGTGSGAIALALASEGPFAHVIATDVSLDALAVARRNVQRLAPTLRAAVELRHGSLLAPITERGVRCIVSNPPYIAFDEAAALPASVRDWEPSLALYSGENGMGATRVIIRDAAPHLESGGLLALEIDERRATMAVALCAAAGCYEDVRVRLDLTGRERFVLATKI